MSSQQAGLYIHVPFCRSKCLYCDFYSSPISRYKSPDYGTKLVEALAKELKLWRDNPTFTKNWRTVYIGGGTPSLLTAPQIDILFKAIGELEGTIEVTVEANPEDVTSQWLEMLKGLGVTRVSMGIQSLDDNELKRLGRRHSAIKAREAVAMLKSSGLNFSVDLIYGIPGQTEKSWEQSLEEVLAWKPHHFSAYLLGYEEGTPLYRMREKGRIAEVPDDTVASMYSHLCEEASRKGYNHYEISNFALPGHKALHNSAYWDGTPYIGIGPSAHSFFGGVRTINVPDTENYLRKLSKGILPSIIDEETDIDRLNDYIVTSLRTSRGMNCGKLHELCTVAGKKGLEQQLEKVIGKMMEKGDLLYDHDNTHLFIPEKRWLVSDALLRELIIV